MARLCAFAALAIVDEVVDPRRLGERRGVAETAELVLGDLTQRMTLPEHVFGRLGANWIKSGEAIGPISLLPR
jgi:hypothetical protein